MEGPGILTLLFMIITLPLTMWSQGHANFQRLEPKEQNLQRASHGAAWLAVTLTFAIWYFGVPQSEHLAATLFSKPSSFGWPVAMIPVLLAYWSVRTAVGIRRAWGVRDALLASRALAKLAIGGGGTFLLWPGNVDLSAYNLPTWLLITVQLISIWCLVTGAVRFFLLTFGGSSALRTVTSNIQQKNKPLVAARTRPWWNFW